MPVCGPYTSAFGALAFASVVFASPGFAQVVRGVVMEVGSGDAVEDAVLVLRAPNGSVRATAISDNGGRFQLVALSSGTVYLEVSHLGYANWATGNFALADDVVLDVEVKLGTEAIPLDPILVVAQGSMRLGREAVFERRRTNAARVGGYFITEAEIERRVMATPSKLTLTVPGMSVRPAGATNDLDRSVILASGGCLARTFIDGVHIDQSGGHSIDDLLAPELIAGVEVYPRAMSAPFQYQGAGNTCGVVLFWTKEPRLGHGRALSGRRIALGLGFVVAILSVGVVR